MCWQAAPFVGDFDADGKHDLLVGQFHLGRMRIYRNVGSKARPEFETFEWFTAGGLIAGVPLCCLVVFTPQLVDFDGDGDGLDDLVAGLQRDVVWYRNVGERGRPKFESRRKARRRNRASSHAAHPGGIDRHRATRSPEMTLTFSHSFLALFVAARTT